MTTEKGLQNSSITRVRPFFRYLFDRDRSGEAWLGPLLAAFPGSACSLSEHVRANPGRLKESATTTRPFSDKILGKIDLEGAFEHEVPPPTAFLRYLISTPAALTWPVERNARKTYGDETQRRRSILVDGAPDAQVEQVRFGLAEFERVGAAGSSKAWWAFEGFTEVDCLLETENVVIFVEGKRNEHLSESTQWFKGRNQLVRNCEAVGEFAKGRACGVVVVGEQDLEVPSEAGFERGLLHLSSGERAQVRQRFLGQTTWRQLCDAMSIPFESLPHEREI